MLVCMYVIYVILKQNLQVIIIKALFAGQSQLRWEKQIKSYHEKNIKLQKKIRERQRREKIKNDPVLQQQFKQKEKHR